MCQRVGSAVLLRPVAICRGPGDDGAVRPVVESVRLLAGIARTHKPLEPGGGRGSGEGGQALGSQVRVARISAVVAVSPRRGKTPSTEARWPSADMSVQASTATVTL